jgi:glyceraldehyde 3-phosphate dehydrogenase
VERATTAEEVNALFKAAAARPLAGILMVMGGRWCPSYRTDPRSIIDALSTLVINGAGEAMPGTTTNRGYASRTVELARMVGLA